jgi:hypothetical protein
MVFLLKVVTNIMSDDDNIIDPIEEDDELKPGALLDDDELEADGDIDTVPISELEDEEAEEDEEDLFDDVDAM